MAIAGCLAATPAAADIDLCIYADFTYANIYVRLGDTAPVTYTFAGSQAPCQRAPELEPIHAGHALDKLIRCERSANPNSVAGRLTVSLTRVNPGIGGMQPFLTCGAY